MQLDGLWGHPHVWIGPLDWTLLTILEIQTPILTNGMNGHDFLHASHSLDLEPDYDHDMNKPF